MVSTLGRMDDVDRPGLLLAGRFRLERVVGRGASAVVWEATNTLTSRQIALKIFVGRALDVPRRRDRFLREARAASCVSHPNVLPIDDLVELPDGRAVLVMPLLRGESLRERLARTGSLPAHELSVLFVPVTDALEAAHAGGVVHRDLKPDNLFLSGDPPRLVILDFGVAKLASDGELGLTSTGVTVGTPFYMAPEQLFGEEDVDARADVWALGVLLFECLSGRRPTEAPNLGQLLKKVSSRSLPELTEADVPDAPHLATLVRAMLSIEREDRPSLAEVRSALLGAATQETLPHAAAATGLAPPRRAARTLRIAAWTLSAAAALAALGIFSGYRARQLPGPGTAAAGEEETGAPGWSSVVSSAPEPIVHDGAPPAAPAAPPPPSPLVRAAAGPRPPAASLSRPAAPLGSGGAPASFPAVSRNATPPRIVEAAPF